MDNQIKQRVILIRNTADQMMMPVINLLDRLAIHGASSERREALHGCVSPARKGTTKNIAIVEGRSPVSVKLMEELMLEDALGAGIKLMSQIKIK